MFIVLAAAVALLVAAADFYYITFKTPMTDKPFHFELTEGQSFTELSSQLARAGLIPGTTRHRRYWQFHAMASGSDRRIRTGTYRIEPGMTLRELLDDLVSGNTLRYNFTIYEGWNFREIVNAMSKHPQIALESTKPDVIRAHLGIAEASPEGWIFPETYTFEKNQSNLKLLVQAHELMKKKLAEAWETRASGLPLKTRYDALILASIVEKETSLENELARIAGVFILRLEQGIPLQADPTVIYGLGETFDGDLRRPDLRRNTPYNSYTRKGLPPTPIAMPGEKAIKAVLNPATTGELYFVSKGDGSHHFSRTYEEHRSAVQHYQLKK